MKTELEIEIKKIRQQLRIHGLAEDEKALLREKLSAHKEKLKNQKKT